MRDDLQQAIDTFLEERRESNGGWAPVTHEDMAQLHSIINLLIEKKWAENDGGNLPVEYRMVDRNKEHFIWPCMLPYTHTDHTESPLEENVRADLLVHAISNLSNLLDTEFKVAKYRYKDK
jgi:hypothetical protein